MIEIDHRGWVKNQRLSALARNMWYYLQGNSYCYWSLTLYKMKWLFRKWFDNIFLNLLFQVQHLVFRIYLYCTNLCNAICLWTNRLCALGKINSWRRTCCTTWFGCSEKTYCETKCKFSVQTKLILKLKFT